MHHQLPVVFTSIFSSQRLLQRPARIIPALLSPGFASLRTFHASTWQRQQFQGYCNSHRYPIHAVDRHIIGVTTTSSSKLPPASPRPNSDDTDFISQCIPKYDTLNPDYKLAGIRQLRAGIEAGQFKEKEQERYEALMQTLAEEEKRLEAADNWFYKGFRSIAWGPTILINVLLSMLW